MPFVHGLQILGLRREQLARQRDGCEFARVPTRAGQFVADAKLMMAFAIEIRIESEHLAVSLGRVRDADAQSLARVHAAQLLDPRRGVLEFVLPLFFVDGREDRGLVREILVQRSDADAGAFGDARRRERLRSFLGEQQASGFAHRCDELARALLAGCAPSAALVIARHASHGLRGPRWDRTGIDASSPALLRAVANHNG